MIYPERLVHHDFGSKEQLFAVVVETGLYYLKHVREQASWVASRLMSGYVGGYTHLPGS